MRWQKGGDDHRAIRPIGTRWPGSGTCAGWGSSDSLGPDSGPAACQFAPGERADQRARGRRGHLAWAVCAALRLQTPRCHTRGPRPYHDRRPPACEPGRCASRRRPGGCAADRPATQPAFAGATNGSIGAGLDTRRGEGFYGEREHRDRGGLRAPARNRSSSGSPHRGAS